MDNRTDPIEIIARWENTMAGKRAFDVWVEKARRQPGRSWWSPTAADSPRDECCVVKLKARRIASDARSGFGSDGACRIRYGSAAEVTP
jgi:hypothetical protein